MIRRTLPGIAALGTLVVALSAAESAPLRPLPFYYDLYTFRGDSTGSTTVVASYAVPVKELEREREEWATQYRFDVSLVLADTALGSVTRTDDSVLVRVARALDGDHLLHTQVELQAAPSVSTVQRVVMTDASAPGIGQLYTTPFSIPDYSGTRLMVSDIALGLPDADGGWRRGDVTLALLPTRLFPESAFDVYYEIYNLERGARYETDVTIQRIGDERGRPVEDSRPVTLGFSGEANTDDTGLLAEMRRVATSLDEGRYRLTVAVEDLASGRTARRSRLFEVVGWSPGATLVPALPRGADVAAGQGGG